MAYDWPGNVRELAAVIDRAALLGNGRGFEMATALGAVPSPNGVSRRGEGEATNPASTSTEPSDPKGQAVPSEERSPDAAMRALIETAWRAAHGRVEGPFGAAAHLKINPQTLRSRMRKLGLDWKAF